MDTLGDAFAAVYIGPVNVMVAVNTLDKFIKSVAKEHLYDHRYVWGVSYGKSPVIINTPQGPVEKRDSSGVVTFVDTEKQTLNYLFHDKRLMYALLGKNEEGETIVESVPDPEYIPRTGGDPYAVRAILGLPSLRVGDIVWSDVQEPETIQYITRKREAPRLSIPMTEEERAARSLLNDNDRFGYEFHTKFSKKTWYDLGPNSNPSQVRIKSAFPDENVSYFMDNRDGILKHLAMFNDGRVPELVRVEENSFIVSFTKKHGALTTINVKGPGINTGSVSSYPSPSPSRTKSSGYQSKTQASSSRPYSNRGTRK